MIKAELVRVRSMNVSDSEARPVLWPAGNKVRSMPAAARKPSPKPFGKAERTDAGTTEEEDGDDEKRKAPTAFDAPHHTSSLAGLRRQQLLLHSNLSLDASCSSDASTDSFCSRASTGRIGRPSLARRHRTSVPRPQRVAAKLERTLSDGAALPLSALSYGKRRCSWVTANTDPCYAAYHDEEWGVPVHDDRKLFELLVLSGALAELTWPAILSKRHIFREVFMDFDPLLVSKLNEKKLVAPGSAASSLLSEPKLRAVVENACQILKITEEFGSFDTYCWSFVNHKPIVSRFRYPRQVPVKTPKADVISKDMVRRGFRSVGQTVIYSFMQAAGITNDHLIGCFRFEECASAAAAAPPADLAVADEKDGVKVGEKMIAAEEVVGVIDLELPRDVDGLTIS